MKRLFDFIGVSQVFEVDDILRVSKTIRIH